MIEHRVPPAASLEDSSRAGRLGVDEKSNEKDRKRIAAITDRGAGRAIRMREGRGSGTMARFQT